MCVLLTMTVVVAYSITCFASDECVIDDVETEKIPVCTMDEVGDYLTQYDEILVELNDKDTDSMKATDRIINKDTIEPVLSDTISLPSVQSAAGTVICEVRNKRVLDVFHGSDYYKVTGEPGITIGLSEANAKSKTYQIQVGASFGFGVTKVANAFWGTSKSKTITYSGTYKVPSKHNGKKVKNATLHMAPAYEQLEGDVYYKCIGYTNWKYKGHTTSKKPDCAYLYKTFVYK